MMRKLFNSIPGRLLCAAAVLPMVAGLFVGAAQPVAVGLLTEPWDKLAHATVFAVLTALLADAVGIGVGLWVARGFWR
jgi:hypothetical protein